MIAVGKPDLSEIPSFYHRYVARVEEQNIASALAVASDRMHGILDDLPAARHDHRYAPGKWSVKEVLQHVIDAERIFAYRALRFARNDATNLPGFEENDYAPESLADRRSLADLLAEHDLVRASTLALFNSFPPEGLARSGTANGHRVSVRGLGWIIAGHAEHHISILAERYFQ